MNREANDKQVYISSKSPRDLLVKCWTQIILFLSTRDSLQRELAWHISM